MLSISYVPMWVGKGLFVPEANPKESGHNARGNREDAERGYAKTT
jgi:hypothetical protein